MTLLTPHLHRQRRSALMAAVGAPILLMGNGVRYRNSAYPISFRQDSSFLYYFADNEVRTACFPTILA